MDRPSLRVELLKLTYAHGRSAEEAVGRARELEAYVDEPTTSEAPIEVPLIAEAASVASPDDTPGTSTDKPDASPVRSRGGRPKKDRGNAGQLEDMLS